MTPALPLRLQFWGVRGSIPTPEVSHLGYGGNTACLEICYGDQLRLILDAGSGLRRLGLALREEPPQPGGETHVFLSHFHWDHVQGLPFFEPLYSPDWRLAFYSAHSISELEAALATQMKPPHSPAAAAIRARLEYRRVEPGGVRLGAITVQAFALNHPCGCVGYRVDAPHASLVYATDHEHGRDPASDQRLREYARGADILVYDAQFTPQEFEFKKGWGHSTWQEGTSVARDAGVKQLILFHHDPERVDGDVSRIVEQARSVFENTAGAREGWSVDL